MLYEVITFKHSDESYEVIKLWVRAPHYQDVKELGAGEVGILICGMKTIHDVKIGDTIVLDSQKETTPMLSGFQDVKPMVFCGIFPVITSYSIHYTKLYDAEMWMSPQSFTAAGMDEFSASDLLNALA